MTLWRSRVAALIVLFFLGTFAGQINHLLAGLRGRVDAGRKVTEQIQQTVTTIAALDTSGLEARIAELQSKLQAGTATPAQLADLKTLIARQKTVPGPAGPQGAPGPPGPAVATTTTTGTNPGGTTTSTQPEPATTTTTRPAATTTTRCAVGVGKLVKVGCS